jgi:hypothetical protein
LGLSCLGLVGAWTGGCGISDTDLDRSCVATAPALGGELEPEAKEKDGRAPVTELSARDLSCSDQLYPCWSFRDLMLGAPKLMWRVKGAVGVGAVLALPEPPSSSSIASSSMEPEFVETLPRRIPYGTDELGVVPDNPRVVMERRRRWGSLGTGIGWVDGPETELPRWKTEDRVDWLKELRRPRAPPPPLELLSEDMLGDELMGDCVSWYVFLDWFVVECWGYSSRERLMGAVCG